MWTSSPLATLGAVSVFLGVALGASVASAGCSGTCPPGQTCRYSQQPTPKGTFYCGTGTEKATDGATTGGGTTGTSGGGTTGTTGGGTTGAPAVIATAATKVYSVTGFKPNADRTVCAATVAVSLPSGSSVTKTLFVGTTSTKKPKTITLKVGTKSDDTTPTGTDGAWAGTSNSFNGSAFKNGTWTVSITPSSPISSGGVATAVTTKVATVVATTPPVESTRCGEFNGFALTFEY